MDEGPETKDSSCLLLCDSIGDAIIEIEEKLRSVLRAEPSIDDRAKEVASPIRNKLSGIFTKLNILSSRIDL